MDDLADEAEDVLGIVVAVGVVGDAGALVGGELVLVNDPFEGGAIAEAVFVGFRRNGFKGEPVVVEECGLVLGEAHFSEAPADLLAGFFDAFERVFGLLFVVDVESGACWPAARGWRRGQFLNTN